MYKILLVEDDMALHYVVVFIFSAGKEDCLLCRE